MSKSAVSVTLLERMHGVQSSGHTWMGGGQYASLPDIYLVCETNVVVMYVSIHYMIGMVPPSQSFSLPGRRRLPFPVGMLREQDVFSYGYKVW